MYNVVRPSDKVYGDNKFKQTNNVPLKSSTRLSSKSTNQFSDDEEFQEDSFEECENLPSDTRPSLNPRYENDFNTSFCLIENLYCRILYTIYRMKHCDILLIISGSNDHCIDLLSGPIKEL